ncbi:MAG: hypothetical protein ABID04_00605 [Patescibacteria group bacterium]
MEIKSIANNTFRVKTKDVFLLFGSGFAGKAKADIVFSTNSLDERITSVKRDQPFFVFGPGEYEISGVEVIGSSPGHWLVKADDWSLYFVENNWEKLLSDKTDDFDSVDVLLLSLPASEEEAKKIWEAVKKISPSVVVVSNENSTQFLDAADQEQLKPQESFVPKREEIGDDIQVVVLKVI